MATVPAMLARRLLLLPLLFVPGCATGGADIDLIGMPAIQTVTAGSASPAGETMASAATTIRYEDEPVLVAGTVDAAPEEVLPALLAAFRSEGLPPDGIDPQSGVISVSKIEWAGEHAGRRMSAFLDCGLSATGRPLADDARIVAFVAAQVREAGSESSRVTVRVAATAWPYESLSGRVRACVTTGELEHTIIDRVTATVVPGTPEPGPAGLLPDPAPLRALPPAPAVTDLPFSAGDQLRVWFSPWDRFTGAFLAVRQDSLVLGKGRRTSIPLGWVQEVQVKRMHRSRIVAAAVVGVAAGITIATTTDVGIGGRHAVQGRILNPGLGALAGGLAGALVGALTFGSSWVDVPVEVLRPTVGLSR